MSKYLQFEGCKKRLKHVAEILSEMPQDLKKKILPRSVTYLASDYTSLLHFAINQLYLQYVRVWESVRVQGDGGGWDYDYMRGRVCEAVVGGIMII